MDSVLCFFFCNLNLVQNKSHVAKFTHIRMHFNHVISMYVGFCLARSTSEFTSTREEYQDYREIIAHL
jgi:hypothetical protein